MTNPARDLLQIWDSPPQPENRNEPFGEIVCESALLAHKPKPAKSRYPS